MRAPRSLVRARSAAVVSAVLAGVLLLRFPPLWATAPYLGALAGFMAAVGAAGAGALWLGRHGPGWSLVAFVALSGLLGQLLYLAIGLPGVGAVERSTGTVLAVVTVAVEAAVVALAVTEVLARVRSSTPTGTPMLYEHGGHRAPR